MCKDIVCGVECGWMIFSIFYYFFYQFISLFVSNYCITSDHKLSYGHIFNNLDTDIDKLYTKYIVCT